MDGEPAPVNSQRLLTLADNMRDKAYRDSYVATHTRHILARQMRNFRGELAQTEFGELIGKRQTVVSRLENPNYGAWQLRTMLEVAGELNIAVFARFVDFPTFLKYSNDLSDAALHPKEYDERAIRRLVSAAQHDDISPRTARAATIRDSSSTMSNVRPRSDWVPMTFQWGAGKSHAIAKGVAPASKTIASNASTRSRPITHEQHEPMIRKVA